MPELVWYTYDPINIHEWYLEFIIKRGLPAAFSDFIQSIEVSPTKVFEEPTDQMIQARTKLLNLLKSVQFDILTPYQIEVLDKLKYGCIFGPKGYKIILDGIENMQDDPEGLIDFMQIYQKGILELFKQLRSAKDESELNLFLNGTLIGVNQYKKAIPMLKDRDLDFLKNLYDLYPVEDHYDLAEKLGYKSVGGVNLQIGRISNEIIRVLNFKNDWHFYKKFGVTTEGFFSTVHRVESRGNLPNSGKWIMEPNLALALEELNHVRPRGYS